LCQDFPGKNVKLSRRDTLKFLGAGAAATFSPASSLDLESPDQGEWMGYVDGAIRSGERAAQEVLSGYPPAK
jgi:hypothetical protein